MTEITDNPRIDKAWDLYYDTTGETPETVPRTDGWWPPHLTEDQFDEHSYDTSIGNYIKQGWIVLQASMMCLFMIKGLFFYTRPWVEKGWCKTKSLLCFQSIIIFYLAINEFTGRHISGLFIILLFTQYSLFFTFCIMMDSVTTPEEYKRKSCNRIFNKVFRVCMHAMSFGLFVSTFFINECYTDIYPVNFIALVAMILLHQIYDIYLALNGYLIVKAEVAQAKEDLKNSIEPHPTRYNLELFHKQSLFLLIANIFFGVCSILTVAAGYFIINRQKVEGYRQHLLCLHGYEWVYMSRVGNIFGTLHQLLVLMQINITQVVLVRLPDSMGVFKKPEDDAAKDLKTAQGKENLLDHDPPAPAAINDAQPAKMNSLAQMVGKKVIDDNDDFKQVQN